jgi:hypothetical protein
MKKVIFTVTASHFVADPGDSSDLDTINDETAVVETASTDSAGDILASSPTMRKLTVPATTSHSAGDPGVASGSNSARPRTAALKEVASSASSSMPISSPAPVKEKVTFTTNTSLGIDDIRNNSGFDISSDIVDNIPTDNPTATEGDIIIKDYAYDDTGAIVNDDLTLTKRWLHATYGSIADKIISGDYQTGLSDTTEGSHDETLIWWLSTPEEHESPYRIILIQSCATNNFIRISWDFTTKSSETFKFYIDADTIDVARTLLKDPTGSWVFRHSHTSDKDSDIKSCI